MREGKSKSIFYYIFKFAGDRKNKYIQTVLWALMGGNIFFASIRNHGKDG